MKRKSWVNYSVIGCLMVAFYPAARAAELSLALQSGSVLWLEGDSTLHPYSSTATVVNLKALFKEPAGASATLAGKLANNRILAFEVEVPVVGLKSHNKGLDKNLHKALKAADFPTITFRLKEERLLPAAPPADGIIPLHSRGTLNIAGKENPVHIEATAEVLPAGLRIRGRHHLLMTDFGVRPPSLLGFVKTRNEVTVHFDFILIEEEGSDE